MTDLSHYTYGDLVAALRKDLQLDATTDVLPGTVLASLFDQNGRTPFVQLIASARIALSAGPVSLNFPTSSTATPAAVSHNIGRTPIAAGLFLGQSPGGLQVTPFVTATAANTLTANAQASASVTGNVLFYWVAIG